MSKNIIALCLCIVIIFSLPIFTFGSAATCCEVSVNVGDRNVEFSTFKANGKLAIRLRDFADLLTDTQYKFDVSWNAELKQIVIIKDKNYTPTEDITFLKLENKMVEYENTYIKLIYDNNAYTLEGFEIDGHNYIDVEILARLLNFTVVYEDNYIRIKAEDNTVMTISYLQLSKEQPQAQEVQQPKIDPKKPVIALTFDDGPRNDSTDKILDALDTVEGRATFFVNGKRAEKYPELIKAIVEQGSQVGNHTYSHIQITKLGIDEIKREINLTSNAVYSAAGVYPMIGRPPYGSVNDNVRNATSIPWFNWSIDTEDWKHKNPDYVYNYVVNNARDGAVILLHDLHPTTAEAMQLAIPKLSEMGYQLVTIDELAQINGGYENVPGYIK